MANQAGAAGGNFFDTPVFNASIPPEGPKSLPMTFPFIGTPDASFTVDLTLSQTQQFISIVQGAFFDNSANDTPFTLTASGTNQSIVIPPYSQAYLPILVAKPTSFSGSGSCGAPVNVIFLNVPVPAVIWNVNGDGDGASTFNAEQLAATDAVFEITAGGQSGLIVSNDGPDTLYIGPSNSVTSATGYALSFGQTLNADGYTGPMWGICATGATANINVIAFEVS